MKKKVLAALLAGTMVLAMGACGQESGTEISGGGEESSSGETDSTETDSEAGETADGGEEVELTVFAAASLTETLTDISELYKEEHPEVSLVFNFDSSGTLKTQIQEGGCLRPLYFRRADADGPDGQYCRSFREYRRAGPGAGRLKNRYFRE